MSRNYIMLNGDDNFIPRGNGDEQENKSISSCSPCLKTRRDSTADNYRLFPNELEEFKEKGWESGYYYWSFIEGIRSRLHRCTPLDNGFVFVAVAGAAIINASSPLFVSNAVGITLAVTTSVSANGPLISNFRISKNLSKWIALDKKINENPSKWRRFAMHCLQHATVITILATALGQGFLTMEQYKKSPTLVQALTFGSGFLGCLMTRMAAVDEMVLWWCYNVGPSNPAWETNHPTLKFFSRVFDGIFNLGNLSIMIFMYSIKLTRGLDFFAQWIGYPLCSQENCHDIPYGYYPFLVLLNTAALCSFSVTTRDVIGKLHRLWLSISDRKRCADGRLIAAFTILAFIVLANFSVFGLSHHSELLMNIPEGIPLAFAFFTPLNLASMLEYSANEMDPSIRSLPSSSEFSINREIPPSEESQGWFGCLMNFFCCRRNSRYNSRQGLSVTVPKPLG